MSAPFADPVGAESRSPYEDVHVEISGLGNPNRNGFHDHWRAPVGVDLSADFPLQVGMIGLGAHYARVASRTSDVPNYHSAFTYVAWGFETPLGGRLSNRLGVRTGYLWMVFDRPPGAQTDHDESELGFALTNHVRWDLGSRWSVSGSVRYRVVMTEPRLRHWFVGAGIGRTYSTPAWLVEFLQ